MADQPRPGIERRSTLPTHHVLAGVALAAAVAAVVWQGGPMAVGALGVLCGYTVLVGRSHAHQQTASIEQALHVLADPDWVPDDTGLGSDAPEVIRELILEIKRDLREREQDVRDAIQGERLKTLELEVLADRFQEASNRLAEANEELEAFSYSASHDMAAPLRVIEGLIGMVIEDWAERLDDTALSHLKTAHGSAQRLLGLLKDLLVLSRLRPPEREDVRDVSIAEVVENIATDLQDVIPERGHLAIMANLPTVQTPPDRLRQVLQNLISNGFKYNDSEEPVVTIDGWTEGGIAVIRVTDNGIGIPESMQEEAFGLFTRLHADRTTPGTGAGLAIARRCIRSIGGELWIEGSSDAGTSFVIAIPVFFSSEAAGIRWGEVAAH